MALLLICFPANCLHLQGKAVLYQKLSNWGGGDRRTITHDVIYVGKMKKWDVIADFNKFNSTRF